MIFKTVLERQRCDCESKPIENGTEYESSNVRLIRSLKDRPNYGKRKESV